MSTAEACTLLVDTTRELALARAEVDSYRLVARAGVHHAHDLHVENQRLRRQLEQLREELRRQYQVTTSNQVVRRRAA